MTKTGSVLLLALVLSCSSIARGSIVYDSVNAGLPGDLAGGSGSLSRSYSYTTAPLFIDASGDVQINLTGGNGAFGESFVDITFTLNGLYSFTLDGTLDALAEVGFAQSAFTLNGPGINFSFTSAFSQTGTIGPGQYVFTARSRIDADNNGDALGGASYDVLFTVAPQAVPEPTSLAVWSLLCLAGGGYGWRKSQQRTPKPARRASE